MDYSALATELLRLMFPPWKMKMPAGDMASGGFALMFIKEKGRVTPKEISDVSGVTSARIAVILNELEENQLITREIDPEDRRRIIVGITEKGEELSKKTVADIFAKTQEFLIKLGENDAKELVRIAKRIVDINCEETNK